MQRGLTPDSPGGVPQKTMEDLLRQAFLYYDVACAEHLSIENTLAVLRSANIAVDIDDVRFYMNAQYADSGEVVTSVDWNACLQMARVYYAQQVGRAKVGSSLATFEVDSKKQVNVQELRHCLRALTPANLFVTGTDVADFTLNGVVPGADGKAPRQAILDNF